MAKKEQVPAIRFQGFADPWEQRKLGELYTERNERGNDTLQILSVSIHSGVSDGELDTDGLGKMVRRSEDKSTYKHVYVGDLIFNMMRAWQGAIGTTKSEGMISPAYISAIPSDEVYPPFMSYLLRRKEAINQINNLSYGVTDFRKRLYWDSFVRVSCLLPSVEEQRYITEVLEKIDTLITLHQRKYDKLVAIKRSMLEKMFPREGSRFPEIRFAGFTDPWEQRKLSEVFSSYTDPVDIPHDGYERLGIRSHAKGTFHSYVPAGHELQTAQMHRVAANKFIVNITFGWEHAVAVTDENDAGKLVSHRFPQFSLSDELDPQFLKFIILDERFRHHLWLASPGGAGRNRVLNLNQMLQYEIQIPCVAEQRKIAGALINIDTLITLHQRKLEKLQAIKRSMLEKMFV